MQQSLPEENHIYVAIDLKSFYASVECNARGLDPLTTNLVVADESRTQKTICLAVTPSLKSFGIPGRARLFEVYAKVNEVNAMRKTRLRGKTFTGESFDANELNQNPDLKVSFIAAPPRMALYMQISMQIYNIYLKYVAPEDIHVYSVDEVFMDVTHYLSTYGMTARELTTKMIADVYAETGITATAGIGTNLYLCKIALDIGSKHVAPDENGVRIAELNEYTYRQQLWGHRPLTDFWRVGRGYAKKLEAHGLYTMGDVARCSIGAEADYYNEDLLYQLFGINAELLIDHAWGWEPCTIADIKGYKPEVNSISSGQVLHCAYSADKARLVIHEMADQLALDLVDKGLVTDQMVLTVGYDIENLSDETRQKQYHGEVTIDRYGRRVPKHAHGTENLSKATSSSSEIIDAVLRLYDRIINPKLLVRRMNLVANHVEKESAQSHPEVFTQLDLFTDYTVLEQEKEKEDAAKEREKKLQKAMLDVKKKFGKNAILKGMNLQEGATAMDRNRQIGGHKS